MFEWITGIIERLGYLGVLALTFLENLFPPIPSELVIPLAGFVAAKGVLRLDAVIVAGTAGSLMGATLWYAIGRRIGERRLRAWVDRSGKWLTLSTKDIDRAQAWFARHGRTAVLVGRVIPGVRTLISLPAGFTGMPLGPFLFFSTIGTLLWTAGLAYAGVALRASYTVIGDYMDVATNVLLAGGLGLLARRYVRCWTKSA